MATNVKILLRRGLRSEISADTLSAGELGYTTDTNQLYVGTAAFDDAIIFDPFANAHATVQTYLNTLSAPFTGLEIDEDLIIKNIPIVTITAGAFVVGSEYTIKTTGTTDFTLIGAADSNPGTIFTATGAGAGTGTARTTSAIDYTLARVSVIAGAFDIGKEYLIESLGTTTQAEWNTTAGTTGLTYAVGSSFTVATGQPGAGTGTAYLRFVYIAP